MKTISFQVTDEEYEQARLIARELFACCPGFNVSALARTAHSDWCHDLMKKVARKRASEDTSAAFGIREAEWREMAKPPHLRRAFNVVLGPWKFHARGNKMSQPTPETL